MQNTPAIKILGIGSPIVDILVRVNDAFLTSSQCYKGSVIAVDKAMQNALLEKCDMQRYVSSGGSAANTIYALTRIGLDTAFKGTIGQDENGETFRREFENVGCDCSRLCVNEQEPTAVCLIFVTPDAQRTMRPNLGASLTLKPEDFSEADFEGITHVHLEGYLLRTPDVLRRILELAYDADCTVSLDLGSEEVVRNSMDILPGLIEKYVSIVFANECEAAAFASDTQSWQDGFDVLRKLCPTVCVKQGARGAAIACVDELCSIKALNVAVPVDSTAAGDLWAAGFLYAYLQNYPLRRCGECASLLASEVIKIVGSALSITDENWDVMMEKLP